jgi:phospholipid/cholesterol/gamma-HCH transport system substrate-binding protein
MTRGRLPALAILLAAATFGATSCGSGGFSGLYGAPLPGGADLGDHPYIVTADFADVLDLVPQASVKVNDVSVGRVDKIDLARDNRTAEVSMSVNGDVHLPGNSSAELRQSSLLGEKYVELVAPAEGKGTGTLGNGAVIPIGRTNRSPEVEEVLGALSLLLNGGGIGQIQNIVRELNSALSGNEPELRALLSNLDSTVSDLDGQRTDIVAAIDSLDRLSATLAGQTRNITAALRDLAPGLQVLNEQRDQLVTMLTSLDKLSGVAVDTVDRSHSELVADLKQLAPTIQQLAKAGDNLPKSLQVLVTYPFTDYTVNDVKGDYFNADVTLDLDLSSVLSDISNASTPVLPLLGSGDTSAGSTAAPPTAPLPLPAAQAPATPPPSGLAGLLGVLLGGGAG